MEALAAEPPREALGIDRAEWDRLALALEDAIPAYERMNRLMSLGQVGAWRRFAAAKANRGEAVVEVGSGPGVFAALLAERGVGSTVLVDPLPAMHRAARGRAPGASFVGAIAERLPLASGSVDRAFCLFSFRDFLDKRQGLRELRRVLRPGGWLHVLEPVKGRGLKQALVDLHVNVAVPLLASLVVPRRVRRGWRGNPYRAFAKTYRDFGTPEFYAALMREEGFRDVKFERLSLGGAALWSGRA